MHPFSDQEFCSAAASTNEGKKLEKSHDGYTLYIHRGGMCDADSGKSMWNSQGIRISKEVLKEADIAVDDILDVIVSNGVIILVKPFRHKTLEERAAAYDGMLYGCFYVPGKPFVTRIERVTLVTRRTREPNVILWWISSIPTV